MLQIKLALGRCAILRNKILYDLCKACNKKNCDHTSTEVDACRKSILENKGNKRNWPEEFHKRQLAFFNAIPEEGTISEYDHILKFPYGPSVYRRMSDSGLFYENQELKKQIEKYVRFRSHIVNLKRNSLS